MVSDCQALVSNCPSDRIRNCKVTKQARSCGPARGNLDFAGYDWLQVATQYIA